MRTELNIRREFVSRLRQLTVTHNSREVWVDFLVVSFCSLYWGDNEVCLAEISTREARYTLRENELLAEMFALAKGGILEEVDRSLQLEEDEEWAGGLLRYIMEHI